MTQEKHTPAPWQAVMPESSNGWIDIRTKDGSVNIATLYGGGEYGDWGNACLIAAAPELLEALELFTVNPKDMTFNQRIEHAEKIIAKAKRC